MNKVHYTCFNQKFIENVVLPPGVQLGAQSLVRSYTSQNVWTFKVNSHPLVERVFLFFAEELLNFEACVHEHAVSKTNLKVAYLIEGKVLNLVVTEDLRVHILVKRGNAYIYRLFELILSAQTQSGIEVREVRQKVICQGLNFDLRIENVTAEQDFVVFWGDAFFVTYNIQTDAELLFNSN